MFILGVSRGERARPGHTLIRGNYPGPIFLCPHVLFTLGWGRFHHRGHRVGVGQCLTPCLLCSQGSEMLLSPKPTRFSSCQLSLSKQLCPTSPLSPATRTGLGGGGGSGGSEDVEKKKNNKTQLRAQETISELIPTPSAPGGTRG